MIPPVTNIHGTVIHTGQVWYDCDPRLPCWRSLLVKVISYTTDGIFVTCHVFENGIGTARETIINIDRLKPGCRGYSPIDPHDVPKKDKTLKTSKKLAELVLKYLDTSVKDQHYLTRKMDKLAQEILGAT